MDPKYNPENIIEDTASRNPDMPKTQTSKPNATASLPVVKPAANPFKVKGSDTSLFGKPQNKSSIVKNNNATDLSNIEDITVDKNAIIERFQKATNTPNESMSKFMPLIDDLVSQPWKAKNFYETTGDKQTAVSKMEIINKLVADYGKKDKKFHDEISNDEDIVLDRSYNQSKNNIQQQTQKAIEDYNNGDYDSYNNYANSLPEVLKSHKTLKDKLTPEVQGRLQEKYKKLNDQNQQNGGIKEGYKEFVKANKDVEDYLTISQLHEYDKINKKSLVENPALYAAAAYSIGGMRTIDGIYNLAQAKIKSLANGTNFDDELIKHANYMESTYVDLGMTETQESMTGKILSTVGQIGAMAGASMIAGNLGVTSTTGQAAFSIGSTYATTFADNYIAALGSNKDHESAVIEGNLRTLVSSLVEAYTIDLSGHFELRTRKTACFIIFSYE
jgi:hypothetical protein